jgi:hypothetical protein
VTVLALGGYVFSHQEQVDWVASLNLRKLYLDRCRVLFEARCATPWEVLKKGNLRYPSIDYLKRVSTTETSGYNTWNRLDESNPDLSQTLQFPLRWHDILNHWSVSLKKLTTFEMGLGRWNHSGRDSVEDQNSTSIEESVYPDEHTHEHLSWYNACRNFAAPAPISLDFASPDANLDRPGLRYAPEYEGADIPRRVMP